MQHYRFLERWERHEWRPQSFFLALNAQKSGISPHTDMCSLAGGDAHASSRGRTLDKVRLCWDVNSLAFSWLSASRRLFPADFRTVDQTPPLPSSTSATCGVPGLQPWLCPQSSNVLEVVNVPRSLPVRLSHRA